MIKLKKYLVYFKNNCYYIYNIPKKQYFIYWLFIFNKIIINNFIIFIIIIDKNQSKQINLNFKLKKKYSNILSIKYKNYIGDIILCKQIIIFKYLKYFIRKINYWAHMIIHGILHLMGFNHIFFNKKQKMELLEINLLHKLGYKNPYLI